MLAAKRFGQSGFVVRVDVRVVSAARQSDVREPAIDEGLAGTFQIHVH
jgi:hypothetical protein